MILNEETRKEICECKECFYRKTVSGQAFTDSICKNCGEIIVNPTTDIDNYCRKCCKKLNICKKCGKILD